MKELSYHTENFVADQWTKRYNKNSQPTSLDVFDKKLTRPIMWRLYI